MQKQHQELRMKKAMARAQAEIKRTVSCIEISSNIRGIIRIFFFTEFPFPVFQQSGRKLMPRSQPPVPKPKNDQHDDTADKEREDHLYFFT